MTARKSPFGQSEVSIHNLPPSCIIHLLIFTAFEIAVTFSNEYDLHLFRLCSSHIEAPDCETLLAVFRFDRLFPALFRHQRHDIHCPQARPSFRSAKAAEKLSMIVVIMGTCRDRSSIVRRQWRRPRRTGRRGGQLPFVRAAS